MLFIDQLNAMNIVMAILPKASVLWKFPIQQYTEIQSFILFRKMQVRTGYVASKIVIQEKHTSRRRPTDFCRTLYFDQQFLRLCPIVYKPKFPVAGIFVQFTALSLKLK
jgi:hypothetical protein